MIVPKNCMFCFYYDKDEHSCLKHNIKVGNINSCKNWQPAVKWLHCYEMPQFVNYDQYRLEV